MTAGKKEIQITEADSVNVRKKRHRKLFYWLVIDLVVGIILFLLLLYRPGRYNPSASYFNDYEPGEVSRYLTHELSPKIHDGIQQHKPFEVTISREGLNDIVTRSNWPIESQGILLYKPLVHLTPGIFVLMGTADMQGVKFIVTIEIKPTIDEQGLMNLNVQKLKVGALNVTVMAKMIAKKMYDEKISSEPVNKWDIRTKIVASLLNDEPFQPVFNFNDTVISIEEMRITEENLVLSLVPSS